MSSQLSLATMFQGNQGYIKTYLLNLEWGKKAGQVTMALIPALGNSGGRGRRSVEFKADLIISSRPAKATK